jgi:hypothetical protein
MYDPQTVQLIIAVVALAFFLTFILGLLYGLFLLAKIRSQAVRINKRLDELLARTPASPASTDESRFSL